MNDTLLDKLAMGNDEKTKQRTISDDVIKCPSVLKFRQYGKSYTVISINNEEVQLIQNDTTKTVIKGISKQYLMTQYREYKMDVESCEKIMIDESKIDEKNRQQHYVYTNIVMDMQNRFNGNFTHLKSRDGSIFIKETMKKYGCGKKLIWKLIRKYLQSGFDVNSLYDHRLFTKHYELRTWNSKPGRKNKYSSVGKCLDERDMKIMDKFVGVYKKNVFSSIPQCYKDMIATYYTTYVRDKNGSEMPILMNPDQMPSLNQFRYYLNKKLDEKDKAMIKAKREDVSQGNASLNDSDMLYGIYGPTTVVEMDEQEMDLSAVSSFDPSFCIGRFIIHLIIDVQTKLVMAISVSLDNNSVLGATNCLMNLADDKVEFCKKFGIEITEQMWPSGRIRSMRVDRGSEYMSKEFERICNENNITLVPTPARTASRKGIVEQQFHIFDSMWKDIMVEYGTIQKLHDSNHHAEATLDYFAVTKICIDNVLRHNMTEITNFKRSKEMIRNRVSTAPLNLWNYYNNQFHTVVPIGNKEAFLYSLMTPTVCRISREGIRWEGLWYSYDDPEIDMDRWRGQRAKMDVRMDRRDVSHLYYIKDNHLKIMTLSKSKTYNMDFNGMPYDMYMKFREIQKELMAKAEEQKIAVDSVNRMLIKQVLAENKRDTYANITNIYMNRSIEKNVLQSANAMYGRLKEKDDLKAIQNDDDSSDLTDDINDNNSSDDDDEWPSWDTISDVMKDSERNFIKD